MDIVKRAASLTLQFERGLLTAAEYGEYLMEASARKAEEVARTYTFISICDGVVIAKQLKLSYADLVDALTCYRCAGDGSYLAPHQDCPTDRLLSELNATGASSIVLESEDTPCGTDVLIAYVNR